MPESASQRSSRNVSSTPMTGANGRQGYAYFVQSTGRYLGTGTQNITGRVQIDPRTGMVSGANSVTQGAIRTAGARQAARTSRAFRAINNARNR